MRISDQERQQRRERAERALEWRLFRKNHLFTQKQLAEVMDISRRTIQQIESGRVSPHPQTLRRFLVFQNRYDLREDLRLSG